jgi:hypothetical protein
MRARLRGSNNTYIFVGVTLCLSWSSITDAQPVIADRLQEHGAVSQQPIVPPVFRGHWSAELRECGADPVDDSQVWITATLLNLYETNGHITDVVIEDDHHAIVTLQAEGGGLTFVAKKMLALSPDQKSLTIRNEDDTGSVTFRRCSTVDTVPTFIPHHTMPPR